MTHAIPGRRAQPAPHTCALSVGGALYHVGCIMFCHVVSCSVMILSLRSPKRKGGNDLRDCAPFPIDKYPSACYVYVLSPKEDIDKLMGMCYIIENLVTLSPTCAYGIPY